MNSETAIKGCVFLSSDSLPEEIETALKIVLDLKERGLIRTKAESCGDREAVFYEIGESVENIFRRIELWR